MFKSPNGSALRALTASRSTIVAFAAIWAAGMVALAVIVAFQTRVDTQRRSQVVVERLQRQAGDLVSVAFDPATSAKGVGTTRAETAFRLAGSKAVIDASVNSIANLGDRAEADRLNELDRKYYAKINLLSALVAKGAGADAALLFGRDSRPDGSYGALLAELHRAGHAYGSEAEQSRRLAAVATAAALALLLAACSIALYRAARLTREKHRLLESSRIEAVTDALTGLPNRRKLFADVEAMLREAEPDEEFALGMFDLDGFKAYNDTFGHPAGDALLRRCAQKLAASVKGRDPRTAWAATSSA